MREKPPQPGQHDDSRAPSGPWAARCFAALTAAGFLAALYVFLLSVTLLGAGFEEFGTGFARILVEKTSNPLVGLFIGILATSIVQSSSATTSMVVSLVAAGTLSVHNAVPIVMGANVGTTITCALVSLGHITRKEEFRRAMGGAFVHDFFNIMAVTILLPVEMATGILQTSAAWLTGLLAGKEVCEFHSPLKTILKPVSSAIVGLLRGGGKPSVGVGVAAAVIALVLLFGSLWAMTRFMRKALVGRAEAILDRTIGRAPIIGFAVGTVLTAIVQSSSVVTSILVPLAGAGLLTVPQIFPITLGANVGTTVTAILASLATGGLGLTIALVHLLFNVAGTLLIYPVPQIRRIPIWLATGLANVAAESKRYAFIYVAGTFLVLPGLLIFVAELFKKSP